MLPRTTIDNVFRLGVPSVVLGVLLYGGWCAVSAVGPDVHAFLRAASNQLDVVSNAVPQMNESLRVIASDLPSLRQRVESIEVKLDRALAEQR